MKEKLGAKQYRVRTNLALSIPLVYPVVAFLMFGLLILPNSTVKDQPIYALIANLAAVLTTVFIFVQIFHVHIDLHENGIVIVNTFSQKIIPLDDITVIHWDRPGAYEGTKHTVVRKTNEIAEVMLRGGGMVKISDATHKNVAKLVGEWQTQHGIPREF